MKIKEIIALIFLALMLSACGTTTTSTTTKYDESGNVSEVIQSENDVSDIAVLANAGTQDATVITGSISNFTLGFSGYGLSWKSYEIVRTKSPVSTDENASSGADVLEQSASVVKASKTTLIASDDGVSVNETTTQEEETVQE